MIVPGERAEAIEDLVEEILRVQLLADLAVDAVAHLEHPVAIHLRDPIRDERRDPQQQALVTAGVRAAVAHQRQRGPPSSASRDWHDGHVGRADRTLHADEPGEQLHVPFARVRQAEDHLCR